MEREEEIEIIEAWLNNPQVSTVGITQANTLGIQGLGGVGKSTLAAYFYHSLDFAAKFWADVSGKPDFTVFAEKIILAFGGKVTQPIDITELINNLLYLLSQRRCLLVVDNLETLLDEKRNWQDEYYQQFFGRWQQQGTNSTLFMTTQDKPQSFKGLKYWHSLGGMEIAEGVELFKKFDIIVGTKEELEDFVKEVNGHPLTIKLVAGYLREYCGCQLNQLDFDYKKVEKVEGLHRNKQDACLDWIIQKHLERLSKEQKQFITNLSVYRLPFNCEAARKQIPEKKQKQNLLNKLLSLIKKVETQEANKKIDIRESLQELCNRSLLIKTQDNKFQFESLVQKYVLQQENDLTNAHQQAIEYYRANLKEEESWQVLDDVIEYLEIIDHQCELKQYAAANKSLNICLDFLKLRGYYAILAEINEKLADRWKNYLKLEDKYDYAWVLTNLGTVKRYLGKVDRTIELCNQSLGIFQQIGDRHGVANSLMGLGNAYNSLGEYQRAIDYYQQSKEIFQQIGDRHGEANSLGNLGLAYNSLGEYQRAIEFYQQSKEIAQQIGDRKGIADTWFNLGLVYEKLNQQLEAKTAYENARKLYQVQVKCE